MACNMMTDEQIESELYHRELLNQAGKYRPVGEYILGRVPGSLTCWDLGIFLEPAVVPEPPPGCCGAPVQAYLLFDTETQEDEEQEEEEYETHPSCQALSVSLDAGDAEAAHIHSANCLNHIQEFVHRKDRAKFDEELGPEFKEPPEDHPAWPATQRTGSTPKHEDLHDDVSDACRVPDGVAANMYHRTKIEEIVDSPPPRPNELAYERAEEVADYLRDWFHERGILTWSSDDLFRALFTFFRKEAS